jgi:hypothetical protein
MKIIKSQHEHEQALEQIMMLMDKNSIDGTGRTHLTF